MIHEKTAKEYENIKKIDGIDNNNIITPLAMEGIRAMARAVASPSTGAAITADASATCPETAQTRARARATSAASSRRTSPTKPRSEASTCMCA